jgi:hypothetical protein
MRKEVGREKTLNISLRSPNRGLKTCNLDEKKLISFQLSDD